MSWFAYFKRSLFSKIWIAVAIASAVLAVIRNVSSGDAAITYKIPGILIGILGGIMFAVILAVVFSLLYATIYTAFEKSHKN